MIPEQYGWFECRINRGLRSGERGIALSGRGAIHIWLPSLGPIERVGKDGRYLNPPQQNFITLPQTRRDEITLINAGWPMTPIIAQIWS